jgi:hypothetical protein
MVGGGDSWPRHQLEMSRYLRAPAALPLEKNTGTHWTGGRMYPRTGLDDVEKNLTPTGTRTPSSWPSNP